MPYYDKCNLTLMKLDDPCGCAITKCSLYDLDCEALKNRDWYEEGLARTYAQVREGRICGVPEDSLTTLLLSRLTTPKTISAVTGIPLDQWSMVAPYFEIPYKGVINANHFVLEDGVVGANGLMTFTIKNSSSQWATDLPYLERYFIAGYFLAVHYVDGDNIGRNVVFKIVSSANGDSGGTNKATVVCQAPYSVAGWAALSAAAKAVYKPTHGMVELLANNISDLTSHCTNKAANINWKWRDFWWQTIRSTFCITDEYIKVMASPLLSDFQKRFRMKSVAEMRKEHAIQEERQWWNTVFWQTKLSELQTKADYRSLTPIYDPADDTCALEYPSTTEGIFPQLDGCSIPVDLETAALDLDAVLTKSEYLARYRGQKTGESVNRVEWLTDRTTANNIRQVYGPYMKAKYGLDNVNLYYQPGQKMEYTVNNATKQVWNYDLYLFRENGLELAVMSHRALDDRLLATPTADKSSARFFMAIDWTDIDLVQGWNHSVVRKTNEADELYKCVIEIPKAKYFLKSQRLAVVLNDPNRHMVYHNFSDNCPTLTSTGCTEYSAQ